MNASSFVQVGDSGPVFLLLTHDSSDSQVLISEVQKLRPDAGFVLAVFEAEDWNRDYSPWQAANADATVFGGRGADTLDRIRTRVLPEIRASFPDRDIYILGYSLAGLFALWSLYMCTDFAGGASCSGSLWIDGWDAFAGNHTLPHPCSVYLSLGGKEERTDNPLLCRVGDRTRIQEKLLKADKNALRCALEMNSGGHFANHSKRLAKAIVWLLDAYKKPSA